MKTICLALTSLVLSASTALAATLTFGATAPTPSGSAAISNWIGATFDADNIGGSGVNSDGGTNNGAANDGTTYVSNNRAAQGETFTTGSNAGGYTITAITVRAAGYTNNTASGTNTTTWGLNSTTSTFYVRVGQISGTTFIPYTIEYAASGGTGNPGVSSSANGSGTYLTFTLKAPIVLLPNTVYAFDIGTTGDYFEMLGIHDGATGGNPYANGTAYTSGASGAGAGAIATQTGDRVFMVDLAPYTAPTQGAFVHPGLLNTDADFVRMRNNVALGNDPWVTGYNALTASWLGSTPTRAPRAVATITRSSTTNNTPILYQDVAAAYGSALRWKISGDTAYADEAVRYLNAWSYTLTTVNGDSNANLCNLYGYQFACVAEIMRTYPGWAPADFAQFQTMMTTIFYPLANNFLTGHNGTAYDHYWANWDLCAMDDIYAIGVLTDNPTMTNQAITYFKNGLGTGCIDRTVNFIHPGLLGQGQESGRDQGHATLDLSELASFCQMTWNQGTDLYSYENNRVLSMAEYAAKYNLGNSVPFAPYSNANGNSGGWLQEVISSATRGSMGHTGWATFYNHYVNIMGLAAPYTQMGTNGDGTYWYFGGDDPGWDYLTTAVAPIATGANPSLTAIVTAQQPVLSWWGSAYATSYNVLRSTTSGSGYTTIASGLTTNTYTDTSVVPGTTYYYVVNGTLTSGTTGNSNEATAIIGTSLYAQLKFDETSGTTASDSTGNGWAGTLVNGATWTTGTIGGAVNLSSASSQYINLPNNVASDLSDFTISAWVNLSSISNWARIFDIGYASATSINERYFYLTASNGSVPKFGITHSGSTGEEGIISNIPLPLNQWAHIAVTMNGPIATLYINGNAVGQNRNMFTTPNRLPGGINYAYIGKSGYSADPYLNGKVDDFRIYRGPLSVGAVYTLATGLQPATPPSAAPTNLAVTALAGNQNSLSWTATAGAANYTVLRATSSGGPYSIVATIVPGTTYIDTGLTAGTTYYYEVDGANTGGDGAISTASSSVVALPPLPSVPAGLTAISGSTTTAVINWTAAANAYSYNVKRSLTSGGPYTTIASGLTATTYTDTGLTAGTTYYYVISSVNTAAESANSTEDSATPSDLLVHLRFDETSGATSADASGNGWNATLVNAPTWTPGIFGNALNFASASTQYGTLGTGVVSTLNDFTISVWVKMTSFATWARAYDFGSGTSNYMFLAPQGIAAGKPRFAIRSNGSAEQDLDSSVAITTGTWTQITVTLTGGVGKMYINGVLVGTNSAMTLTPASLGSTNLNYLGRSQFSADPYLNGSIDDLRINGHAFTAAQVAANASPSPVPPTGLGNNSGDGSMTLNWAVDETATTYNVKRATVSGGPYTTVGTGLTTPTFLDTGLTNGTTYYYVVSAVNWLGESANSTETSGLAYTIVWASQDIGPVGATGSSSVSGGTVTVNGSGADIWGTADAFQFRSVPITGNCIVTARVLSMTNTNVWAKAGVMIRDTLDANAIDAAMLVTPTTAQGIQWQSKNTTGGGSTNTEVYGMTPPYWVRLVRTGTTIQGYRSTNGVNWTSQGSATLASLGATANVGLAVSSHVAGTLCTAVFDNVSVNWVPDAPSNVTATPAPFQVALNWTSVPNAASYNVYSSSVSGGPYTLTASGLTSPSYVETNLTSGTPIYYVVTATNVVGEGLGSDETNAAPILVPAAPTGLAASGGNNQVALTWAASIGATSYNVKRSTTSGGPYSNIATGVTTASYTDTSAANGTTYYYVVSGVSTVGEGSNSAEASGTTVPSVVTGLTAVASSDQSTLSWTAASGAVSYNIGQATTSGGPFTTIASGVTATSYTATGLINGTTYYYVVTAANATGTGSNSAPLGTTSAAQNLYWDTVAGTTGLVNGSGNWNVNSTALWATSTSGSNPLLTYLNDDNAYFETAGTLTATIASGTTIEVGSINQLVNSTAATITGGTLQIDTNSGITNGVGSGNKALTIASAIVLNSSNVTINNATTAGSITFSGVISQIGSGSAITKTGAGTLVLNGANTFTGGVTLSAGTLTAGNNSALGTGTLTLSGGTLLSGGSGPTLSNNIVVGGGSTIGISSGNISLNGTISGSGNLTLGNSILDSVFLGGSNTMTGGTITVVNGNNYAVVRFTSASAGNANVAWVFTGSSINRDDSLNFNGGTISFGSLTGSGAIQNGYGSASTDTIQAGNLNLNDTFSGILAANGTQVLAYTKVGTGTQTFTGINTYTGATTVSAGTLWINGSTASGSAVSVSSGATLGGTGTVNGATTIASGGNLAPGASSAGTLTFAGGLNLNGGSVLNVGLGSSSDKVAMSAGTYTGPSSGTVTVNITAFTGYTAGTYSLITGATGISAASYTLGTAPAGYTYALSAGSGTLTLTVSAPAAPTGLAVDGFGIGNNLSWAGSTGATSYSVMRSTGGAYTTIASGLTGTTYADFTAANGTAYNYEVTATNLGGTSAASTAASATTTAPSVYLKFDEGTGTTTADAAGNGWTGTLVNTPAWVAGRSINGIGLNGTNQYLTLPSGVVGTLTNCTIAMWANLDAVPIWSRLFDFGTGTNVNMFLTPNNGATIRFAITTSGGGNEQRIDGTTTFPIGGWHHVAVTLAGAVGTLYVDGTQVGQNTAMTLNPSSLGSTNLNFIGHSQYPADPYLNGAVDEFRIYNSALTSSQITSLIANSPLGLQNPPTSLVATAGSNQVALTWTAAAGATGYSVLRATVSGGPYTAVVTNVTTTSYTDTGLTTGTTYYYAIMAFSATSESANSNQASATSQ